MAGTGRAATNRYAQAPSVGGRGRPPVATDRSDGRPVVSEFAPDCSSGSRNEAYRPSEVTPSAQGGLSRDPCKRPRHVSRYHRLLGPHASSLAIAANPRAPARRESRVTYSSTWCARRSSPTPNPIVGIPATPERYEPLVQNA